VINLLDRENTRFDEILEEAASTTARGFSR
jgi:hypothetical protein